MSKFMDTTSLIRTFRRTAPRRWRRPADTYRRPAHRRWRLSADEGQEIIAMREQGKSWNTIACETGIESHAIVRELKALGLPTTPFSQRMTLSDDEIELVMAMRAQGRIISYVAAEMGVSWYVISRELKARGLSSRRATCMPLSDGVIELVVAMRAQGRLASYVAAEMGISWKVISHELKARGLSTARATARQRAKRMPGFWGLFGDDPNPAKVDL
jgi:hypothetical protein